jgi:Peptidase family M28
MRFLALLPLLAAGIASAPGSEVPAKADPDIAALVASVSAERIQKSVVVLTSFKTRHTLSDPQPSGDGIGAAGGWIRAEFQRIAVASGGRLKVQTDEFDQPALPPLIPRPVHLTNIVATLPGSRPDAARRVYVLAAHYDCRAGNPLDADSPAPGADADASGVAAVLEAARVLAVYEYPATIQFVVFAGTAQGLVGSTHWAAAQARDGVAIAAVLNDDTIGSTHAANGRVERGAVRVFAAGLTPSGGAAGLAELVRAGGENDSPHRELARALRDIGALYVPSMEARIVFRGDRQAHQGDQAPFQERGYPAVRFTEAAEDYRRQDQDVGTVGGVACGDTTDLLDYVYIAGVTRLNAAGLAALARAPGTPRRAALAAGTPGVDAVVSWSPSPEPDLAGYRVVWRETTQPFWEHSLEVGRGDTHAVVPGVCGDDVVLGVEAFDAAGHSSPAACALPEASGR